MKKTRLTLMVLLASSFSIYAANNIVLNIIDTNNGNSSVALNIPLKDQENVSILSSGDVSATTTLTEFETELNNIGITAGNAPIISGFSCTNGTSCNNITTSTTTVTSTISEDAVYCKEFLENVEVNTTIASFVTSTSYTTQSGGAYKLSCGNNFGVTESQVQINLTAPPVVTINATPAIVNSGDSSTVSWSVANSPTTCTFTGDWPAGEQTNVSPAFYSSPIVLNNILSNKTLSLSCTNTAGTSSVQSINITLQGSSNSQWTTCNDNSPANLILNGNEDRVIIANGTATLGSYNGTYAEIQGSGSNNPWPGSLGQNIHLSLDKNKYIAAQFTTDGNGYDGKFELSPTNSFEGENPAGRTITISSCPGDFSNNLSQARCITTSSTLYWSTKTVPSGPAGFFCELDKNTTYYLNIVDSVNSENDNYETSNCEANNGFCGILANYNSVTF